MEKLNLCTPDGQRLPGWIEREKPIPDGCGIQVVSIWVRNPQGQLLITRRAAAKKSWGGYWENPGGAVRFGEEPEAAVRRELEEETGIVLPDGPLSELDCHWTPPLLVYTYTVQLPERPTVRLQPGETEAAEWVTPTQLREACDQGRMAGPIEQQIRRDWEKLNA